MPRIAVAVLFAAGSLLAQRPDPELSRAEMSVVMARVAQGQWASALDRIDDLARRLEAVAELEELGFQTTSIANRLRSMGLRELELRARTTQVALRRRLHGASDDARVVSALNDHAVVLVHLARPKEALPEFEEALASSRRLAAGADTVVVALALHNLAWCKSNLKQYDEALALYDEALGTYRRAHRGKPHKDVAICIRSIADCYFEQGRRQDAIARLEETQSLFDAVLGSADDTESAANLNRLGYNLQVVGRVEEALAHFERCLHMYERLGAGQPTADLALAWNNVAYCRARLGRHEQALAGYAEATALERRIHGDKDAASVVVTLINRADCLRELARDTEAWELLAEAEAMSRRLGDSNSDGFLAYALESQGRLLYAQGRYSEAALKFGETVATRERMTKGRDFLPLANAERQYAACLSRSGRVAEAIPFFERAMQRYQSVFGDQPTESMATCLSQLAEAWGDCSRPDLALELSQKALAMQRRLSGTRGNVDLAYPLVDAASALGQLGRHEECLELNEEALALVEQWAGGKDHALLVSQLANVGSVLAKLGRKKEAREKLELALAMQHRLRGETPCPSLMHCHGALAAFLQREGDAVGGLRHAELELAACRAMDPSDHEGLASALHDVAYCLHATGQDEKAAEYFEQATAVIERARDASASSAEMRRGQFERLKRSGAFEYLQVVHANLAHGQEAFAAAERARARELLDLLEQQRFDAFAETLEAARRRGDEAEVALLEQLRRDTEAAVFANERLLHELVSAARERSEPSGTRDVAAIRADAEAAAERLRRLRNDEARHLGDALPVGRVHSVLDIASCLREGELLLEFTLSADAELLYVLAPDGVVEVHRLTGAHALLLRLMPSLLGSLGLDAEARGRTPKSETPAGAADGAWAELFRALVPPKAWDRVAVSKRVFVAAHRGLHRIPFEALVTGSVDGRPVHWLDAGPPISYVPSGNVLHWLRQRAKAAGDDATSTDLLAVGDPRAASAAPLVPEHGALVTRVDEGGEGARIGLRVADVLQAYDGKPLQDDSGLRDAVAAVVRAVEDGQRADETVAVEVWRAGTVVNLQARPGRFGILCARGSARAAHEALANGGADLRFATRDGEIERLRDLPPLRGAREEAEAVAAAFASKGRSVVRLLGEQATESAIFDAAAKAKYVHFACHGVAEEYAGQSLSTLVLSQPDHVLPGDDGLLTLQDLLNNWRRRLASSRLVVLSACRTNVGPTHRDEAPQALPVGFLFAGASSVVCSRWAVEDGSTKELMSDFYARLVGGETDRLAAFTAARKALKAKYPAITSWAAFLYTGSPD